MVFSASPLCCSTFCGQKDADDASFLENKEDDEKPAVDSGEAADSFPEVNPKLIEIYVEGMDGIDGMDGTDMEKDDSQDSPPPWRSQGSAWTEGRLDVAEMVTIFQKSRSEEKRRTYHLVVQLAELIAIFGFVSLTVGLMRPPWRSVAVLVAVILGAIAILIVSSCPLDELDLDRFFETHALVTFLFCTSVAVSAVSMAVLYPPHLHWLAVIPALLAAVDGRCARCANVPWPQKTSLLSIVATFELVAWAGVYLRKARQESPEDDGQLDWDDEFWEWLALSSFGIFFLCTGVILAAAVTLYVVLARRGKMGRMLSPTVRLYIFLYTWSTSHGMVNLAIGFTGVHGVGMVLQDRLGVILYGTAQCIPVFVVLGVGRERIFGFLARRFDQDSRRAQLDGAFIAELMNFVPIEIGRPWWIYHGREEASFPTFDPRRNWDEGVVAEVLGDMFAVKLVEEAHSENHKDGSIHWLPVPSHAETAPELLQKAQYSLRCIEWSDITPELMLSSRSAPGVNPSRPVAVGEKIDFFMNHSWHDDPEAKFAALRQIAETFRRKHGRDPTFWLDKVCIDQSCISDGLKVLPVNVMACRKVLVLFGDTYAHRLWCVWELFTLFSFAREELAAERVVILPLHRGDDIFSQLANFKLDDAHCYDPNEEIRLRQVIHGVGVDRFNQGIRALAAKSALCTASA
mmetsp:Transcript_25986/g.57346  ORF Transcript_25986/g.57346 Transcript_25986/m.57346 type:complete len:686 (-) Transcript_25986:208-2265(-)